MKLVFHLEDSIYNCALTVRDGRGLRGFELTVKYDGTDPSALPTCFVPRDPLLPGPAHVTYAGDTLAVEVTGDACDVTVTPTCVPAFLQDARTLTGEGESFWEKLACRAIGKLAEWSYTSLFLRTSCVYRLPLVGRIGAGEAVIRLRIIPRLLQRGGRVAEELLECMPVGMFFYELAEEGRPLTPVDALPANRSEVVGTARRVGLLSGVWAYPFTVGRTKRLTRRRGLRRALLRLYRLPPEKRQKRFDRAMEAGGNGSIVDI